MITYTIQISQQDDGRHEWYIVKNTDEYNSIIGEGICDTYDEAFEEAQYIYDRYQLYMQNKE